MNRAQQASKRCLLHACVGPLDYCKHNCKLILGFIHKARGSIYELTGAITAVFYL